MADDSLFLSHNFVERLEIGYRDADFQGDTWPDIGAYEPHMGQWWVARNNTANTFQSQGAWSANWGKDGIPGDYRHLTGNFNFGQTIDIAVYYKKTGGWNVAL